MPAGYSQKSAAQRAERQYTAGYTYVGGDASRYEVAPNGLIRGRAKQGPDLPPMAPGGVDWDLMTRDWYHRFRTSPQAGLLVTETDWDMLHIAAGLLNQYYVSGSLSAYTKFEKLMSKYGVTPGDRKRARIGINAPSEDTEDEEELELADSITDDFEALMSQRPVA